MILGARPHQRPVKAVTVNPHEAPPQLPIEERKELYRKYTLSGNLSIKNAYKVEPQTLILPLKKEKSVIVWNRKQSELNFDFELKNFWLGTSKNVSLVVKNIPAFEGQPEPKSIQLLQSQFAGWPQGQEKVIHGKIYIEDPFVSQISSDLEFMVSVFIDGKLHREFVIPLEIVVPVSKDEIPEGAFELAVSNLPSARTDTLPIDHVLDQNLDFVDYLLLQKKEDKWKLYLMRQDRHLDSQSAPYSVVAESEFIDKFQAKGRVLNNTSRIDIDFDGKSEYVVSFTDDRSMVGNETSPAFVYIFDENLKLKHLLTLDGVRTQMPWNPSGSNEVQWLRVGDKKVPSWVGFGYDPEAKPSLRKTWKNRNIDKRYQYFNEPEIRFYYLDYEKGLQAVSSPEGYDIIDGLAANREQLSQGRVPVLMVKGQESHQNFSSYYAEYAVGEIYNGKVENIKEVDLFTHSDQYRNLLQTRVGSVFSLDNNKGRYNGTFWFDQQKFDENRVSMIAGGDQKFIDTSVGPLRDQFDSALWARFGFYGEKIGASVFVLTNSEMQFHDMTRQQASYTSLRRYTFYPDASTNTVNFPFIIGSRNNEFADFVPTLYTTEGSGFANGVRFVVPYYEGSKLLGVYAPAQLRLKSGEGCVKVDQAFKDDLHGVSYLDYNCRDKIIRVPLIN